MRVLLAPDKFRGTFTAAEVCDHLARGMLERAPSLVVVAMPLADGGEGTLEVVLKARGGVRARLQARGPLDELLVGEYGITPDGVAVIEAARFCGLELVPSGRRDPMRSSSYGLGQAIAAALDSGVRRFLIGLGGTATVDGGAGMARALGYRLLDSSGAETARRGEELSLIAAIDPSMAHGALTSARFTALCDVSAPLVGPAGAARVFAPQKGASPVAVEHLEAGMRALAAALASWKGTDPQELASLPGGGAAGGLGLGCLAFLGASLGPGAASLMEMLGFADKMGSTDLVVTGEGSFDRQTGGGKVPAAVLGAAARARLPAVVVAGRWDGSLPDPRPDVMEVITAQDLEGKPNSLGADHLVELGRRIAQVCVRLAKPSGG